MLRIRLPSMRDARDRPRLLILASTYPRWSADPEPGFVHELARRLCSDFRVTVLTSHAPGARLRERMDGVSVFRYRYAPRAMQTLVYGGGITTQLRRHPWKLALVPLFVLMQFIVARRLARHHRFGIVHAHWLFPQGLVAWWLARRGKGPPYVLTSHGADLYTLQSGLMRKIKRAVCAGSAAVTVVSRAMSNEMKRLGLYDREPLVMPMGVDMHGRFTIDSAVDRSHDEILFVGRLVEKKGLAVLIDAMPQVLRDHPSAFLTIVGHGPEMSIRTHQAASLGLGDRVRFLGSVAQEHLPAYYRRAAVFVAPFIQAASGDREGLGLVSLEALACGCPIVISDLPAVHDVLDEGHGQIIVPPGDRDSLAQALVRRLSCPLSLQEMQRERGRLAKRFDWSVVAEGYAGLLESCRSVVP